MEWTRAMRYQRLNRENQAAQEALAARIKNHHWRQHYHIEAPSGLLNDPNGFVYHRGRYSLCYQWFPLGPVHGLKYWRRLDSDNLARWQDAGIFLSPDQKEDSHGAYSGSALAQADHILYAYTGNHRDADWQRVPYQLTFRYYDDGRRTAKTPFLIGPPPGYSEHVRDPKIWAEADGSLGLVLGAQRLDGSGTALYFTSPDGDRWQQRGAIDCQLPRFGYMWECPDYFSLDGADLLFFCPQGLPAAGENYKNLYQCGYLLGHFDREKLTFRHGGFRELDGGFEYYAVQTTSDAAGRRVSIAWFGLPDISTPTAADGWAHCLTLPRLLNVENGQLRQRPHPDLRRLRRPGAHDGVHFELLLENPTAAPFELWLRADDRGHGTRISYDGAILTFDRSTSGALGHNEKEEPGKGGHERRLTVPALRELRIYADSSSLELFINDGEQTMSGRIFPPEEARQLRWSLAPEARVQCWALGDE